jgi:hypothetical protein
MLTGAQAESLLLAVLAGLALCATLYTLIPREVTAARRLKSERRAKARRRLATRAMLALTGGLIMAVATGWPVAGIGAAALVLAWDKVAGGLASERAAATKVEALAAWTETLRDTMAASAGLEQAIPAAARTAHPILARPMAGMIERLGARVPLTEVLQEFADEADDPDADVIIASLIMNSTLRGPGLGGVLRSLSKSARQMAHLRHRITAQRAQSRRGVQIIVVATTGIITYTAVFDHGFVGAYDSPLGEAVLAVILSIFAAAFAWMRKLARVQAGGRILARPAPDEADHDGEAR